MCDEASATNPGPVEAGHPCFDTKARQRWARVHLPVAPACNVSCNFCDRRFDCPNESRPGVTSVLLAPWQALAYLEDLTKRRSDVVPMWANTAGWLATGSAPVSASAAGGAGTLTSDSSVRAL